MLLSRYAVVPAGHKSTMQRYTRTRQYAERVLFQQAEAWLVDMPELRRVQRAWAISKFGEPTIERAKQLIAMAAGRLSKPARRPLPLRGEDGKPQFDANGEPLYSPNFRERFWREELARLKAAVLYWLSLNEHSESQHVFLNAQTSWMTTQPLSSAEIELATIQSQELVPVLVHDNTFAAAMLMLTDQWEGAKIVDRVPNRADRSAINLKYLEIAEQMWAFLPETPEEARGVFTPVIQFAEGSEYLQVPMGSVAWPSPQAIERNEDGSPRKPRWLKRLQAEPKEAKTPPRTPGKPSFLY